jgi:endo-1,4-beta-xylanase
VRRLRVTGLTLSLLLALPSVAHGATLTAGSFAKRRGQVSEVHGIGRQATALALRGRAGAEAEIVGLSFDRISARLRLAGPGCRAARVTAVLDGQRTVLAPPARRWRTFRLEATPSAERHAFVLRLRADERCVLLFDEASLHLVAQAATRPPSPPRATPIALGAAVDWQDVSAMSGYGDLFLSNFAYMTPENEMKMNVLQPKRDQFDFSTADRMVDWAVAQGKRVHGHTLVFNQQLPGWLTNPSLVDQVTGQGHFDRAQLEQIMRKHITTVMQHYAATVHEWDVVNEALRPDGSFNPGIWLDTIGPEYIEEAFRAARAAVPDAALCYNEIGDEVAGPEADAVYELVAHLRGLGLIDCLGFEMHINAADPPAESLLEQNFARFAALGVDVHISEMDVDIRGLSGDTASRFAAQARVFGDAALACSNVAACSRFTTWGTTDAASWLGPSAQPLPFDGGLAPKPAWMAIQRGISGQG